MIETGLAAKAKILLLTPTPDVTQSPAYGGEDKNLLGNHAEQIRSLAGQYENGFRRKDERLPKETRTLRVVYLRFEPLGIKKKYNYIR
ncbi:MAG: hypothetical protein R6V56_04475 [Lentisphaeria bacterium]